MGLTVKIVSSIDELAGYRRRWSALLERSATNEPTLSPSWMLAWWRIFGEGDGRRLACILVFEGERLVGLAPLAVRRHWYPPAIPFRRVEILASGERDADAILLRVPRVHRGARKRAGRGGRDRRHHRAGRRRPWDEFVVPFVDGAGPMPSLLAESLGSAGFMTELTTQSTAPYIPLPAKWDQYLSALPSQGRYVATRALRDFDAWAKGSLEVRDVRTASDLELGKKVLMTLDAERWGEEGRSGVFASSRFAAFHDLVLPDLLEQGALEMFWITAFGEPVAAVYNIVWNGKVHFYQGGRKLGVPRGVKPGIVIQLMAIRRAIEAGRREYDFLGGAARYKMQLSLATRPLVGVRAARGSLREIGRSFARQGMATFRSLRAALRAKKVSASLPGMRREERAASE